jgi:hypothetical protein
MMHALEWFGFGTNSPSQKDATFWRPRGSK